MSKTKQKFKLRGVWIPVEVFENKKLNKNCCVLFSLINGLDGEECCYASNKFFANILDVSETTISTSISTLIDEGYVEKISFDGRRRTIRINPAYKDAHASKNLDGNLPSDYITETKETLLSIPTYTEYLTTRHWKQVRSLAFQRFGKKCMLCLCEESLHVHHKTYKHKGEEQDHLNDLIILCQDCHAKFHDKLPKEEN